MAVEEKTLRMLQETKWAVAGATGYMGAMALNVLSLVEDQGFPDAILSVFFDTPWHVAISLVVALIFLAWGPLKFGMERRALFRTSDRKMFEVFDKFTESILRKHELEGISWGFGQTVLASPRPQQGWKTQEVKFFLEAKRFKWTTLQGGLGGEDLDRNYKEYVQRSFREEYSYDSPRLMLSKRPSSFSDDGGLRLHLAETSWSQLQFFWKSVVSEETRPKLLSMAFDDDLIEFPNSLSLHLIIKTSDGKILLTQAHRLKKNDYPESWACSVGEQIDPEDVLNLERDCVSLWVGRALREELALGEDDYLPGQTRVLAVSLEADISNFALITIAQLEISSMDIRARLASVNREDNEFSDVAFIDLDEIPSELVEPTRQYHPSSSLRMIYAYIHARGQSQLRQSLMKEVARSARLT